jgi:hypothetical protein
MIRVTGKNGMTRNEALIQQATLTSVGSENIEAKVIPHPAIHSMGQVLAGHGHLVFEGEMLDTPISWHPNGISH